MSEKRSVERAETVEPAPGVQITRLSTGDRLQAQHVRMAPDSRVDTHDHPNEQLTYLVDGALTLILDGEPVELAPGDSLAIPGEVAHAAVTGPDAGATAIDVFTPPRDGLPDLD